MSRGAVVYHQGGAGNGLVGREKVSRQFYVDRGVDFVGGGDLMTAQKKPKLLSGGNPQIPKGEGDGPVQKYIAAMPGWKRNVGERLDSLIVGTAPDVHKAVKWNQPFYGHEGDDWFLSFRCYTNYVQVQFFKGTSLDPIPPKESKHEEVRYFDIHEDELDEKQLLSWVEQASRLPGEKM